MMIPMVYTRRSKYEIVSEQVKSIAGTLVDVGARDRILQHYLHNPALRYISADAVEGHDLLWSLEAPVDCPDAAYDVVVALDVLEHVEQFHLAFSELLRVTRDKLFVSLPNMTNLAFRLHFFATGQLSGKYALLPEHQGDRHRWLTHYDDVCAFMLHQAQSANVAIRQYNIIGGYSRLERWTSYLPLPPTLRTYTLLFEITKGT